MKNYLGNLSIGKRFAVVQLVAITVCFVLLIGFILQSVTRIMEDKVVEDLRNEVLLTTELVDAYNSVLKNKANLLLRILANNFPEAFSISAQETVNINGNDTPVLRNGSRRLNLAYDDMDRFTRLTDATATVFAVKDGDFVRVTTSLKKEDGTRAVGTMLGKEHPAYGPLMRGVSYTGRAKLFGKEYVTAYQPIKDGAGRTIGALYIGFDLTEWFANLRKEILSIKIGKTGYIYVVDAADGQNRGQLLIHPTLQGKNLMDERDARTGYEFGREIIEKKQGTIAYSFATPGTDTSKHHLAVFAPYEDWNWVIVGGAAEEELKGVVYAIRNNLIVKAVIVAVLMLLLLAYAVRTVIVAPLRNAVDMIKDIAQGEGDLTKRLSVTTKDEMGELARWFNTFADKLHEIISLVSGSAGQIADASQSLHATAKDMASGANEQTAQATQVASAVEEMSATIEQVAKSSGSAAEKAKVAEQTATKGSDVVQQTVEGMGRIAGAVKTLQSVIEGLSRNTEKIGDIVQVIDDVADQTNLLALNAAIEAARAGEQGRGFAVVADEVRKLAERTIASTKEISDMVKSIQEETGKAVGSMDASVKEVDAGVRLTEQSGNSLIEILSATRTVQSMVQQIATAAEQQAAAVKEITESVESIAQVSKKNAASIQRTTESTKEISSLTGVLHMLVGKFKLKQQ